MKFEEFVFGRMRNGQKAYDVLVSKLSVKSVCKKYPELTPAMVNRARYQMLPKKKKDGAKS